MLAAIAAWVLKFASGDLIGRVIDLLGKSDAGRAKLEEIAARAATEQARDRIAAGTTRQAGKMSQPVFWVLICLMLGPPLLILWGVALYNVFWWQHGIWPQGWAIADFPPSIKPWVEKTIDWLFDPLGLPSVVGSAGAAGWLAGRR